MQLGSKPSGACGLRPSEERVSFHFVLRPLDRKVPGYVTSALGGEISCGIPVLHRVCMLT